MSNFRDLIARMAIDAEFARHARANPDAVARQYRLSPQETDQLRGLADAAASAGPIALGARLSKMGGLTSSLSSQFVLAQLDTDGDGIPDWQDTDDDGDGIPDSLDGKPLINADLHAAVLTGPVLLDQDVIDPRGDPDHDGIPNILDSKNNNSNTSGEAWGDADHDGKPNLYENSPGPADPYFGYKLQLAISPDSDGDGIKDMVDALDNNTDTSKEALGDNDHDGIPNYLDKKFNITQVHPFPGTLVLDGGTPDPTPPPGDPADPGDTGTGGTETPPTTGEGGQSVPGAPGANGAPGAPGAAGQPVMLADDAVSKPVLVTVEDGDDGMGAGLMIVGGAALVAGAAVGVVASGIVGKADKADIVQPSAGELTAPGNWQPQGN